MGMKTRPWIPVLIGGVLLFGAVDQAWCQPKCEQGVIYRCAHEAAVEESSDGEEDDANTCRQAGWESQQKACGKTESVRTAGIAQKGISFAPRRHMAAGEPRKLALPSGAYKRMGAIEGSKRGPVCGSVRVGACLPDCRYDTIFGTETILGECLPHKHIACPYGCDGRNHQKPLARAFSHLDESLSKLFPCQRGNCGKSEGKGCGHCVAKSKCEKDMHDAPVLEGQPHEPRREANPFRDDSIDSNPNAPALLPPAPLPPAASAASRIRPHASTVKLGIAHAKPAPRNTAPSLLQATSEPRDNRAPAPQTSPVQPTSMRQPSALFSSLRLE